MAVFSRSSTRKKAYQQGLWAERLVALRFRLRGYRILAHRFQTPAGEIDLVVAKPGLLVCVEVKARPTLEEGLFALRPAQQKRLLRAATFACAAFPRWSTGTIRFDLAIQRPWRWPVFITNMDL